MRPKPKPGALFPGQREYPNMKKMADSSEANDAVYEFFDHLRRAGYVLARRNPETGELRAMKTTPTVEYEVMRARGVDRHAYGAEADALRAAYPHLWQQLGLDPALVCRPCDSVPEFAEPPPAPARRPRFDLGSPLPGVGDDELLSVAEAYRRGVFRAASYSAARMKLMRSRRLYPELTPKMRPRGAETLYLVRDLRAWEDEYDRRSANNVAWGVLRTQPQDRIVPTPEPVPAPDALAVLLGKMRGEE
jgi:hypothetical protein